MSNPKTRVQPLVLRAKLLTGLFGWTAGVFFKVERRGGQVPGGPLMVVANHPNSLMDPLVLFRVLDRETRPLAKAPLFDQRLLGLILRSMGGLPVYRKQDLPDQVHKNRGTFDAAVAALHRGDAIQIYPEGLSHSEPNLAPLRTGAARIAFQAESQVGWTLGLKILPVGLTYRRKALFGGNVVATVGTPIEVGHWRASYDADERESVRSLTGRIREGLEAVTLNAESKEERELIEVAERVYAREVGLASWRERETLAERLPRLRYFSRAAAWLKNEDPDQYRSLASKVRAYERATALLGVGDAEVPPVYEFGPTLRYILREGGILLAGLPFAAVGLAAWLPVYLVGRLILGRIEVTYETTATYKFSVHTTVALFTLVGWTIFAWLIGGGRWAMAAALALVPLGLVALAWRERWIRTQEDLRLFKRVARRKGRRQRLAQRRAQLVAEFDRIARELQAAEREAPASSPRSGGSS